MKPSLRAIFLQIRKHIPEERRRAAAQELFSHLVPSTASFQRVASFASMKDEIDLSAFNLRLAGEGRLLLSKREGALLDFYSIRDPHRDLTRFQGELLEPNPKFCTKTKLASTDLLLVPGLAFDRNHYRLGYGKGHYDRLLAHHIGITSWGIAFREQLSDESLQLDPWDIPVHKLFLF